MWDLRSVKHDASGGGEGGGRFGESVYVIEREEAKGKRRADAGEGVKVFSVDWDAEMGIISGGEDRKVQINKGSR